MNRAYPNNTHAIVFPYPLQGHIAPALSLAVALASRGFTVTYVLTDFVHHAVSKSLDGGNFFAGARESGLDMHCATVSDGFPLDFDRRLNSEFTESMLHDFHARADELVGRITRSCSATDFFLVSDTLFPWPSAVAGKYGLVNVSFWTEPATVFSIIYHLDLLKENGHFPNYSDNSERQIGYIPGVECISRRDLMSYIQHPDAIPWVTKIAVKAFEEVKNADFILCNTVQELESQALSALICHHPTYAIGPINLFNTEKISLWPQSDCTKWLNSKPPGSVLYISFGSIAQISKEETVEIAHGLIISQVNFLWVLKTRDDDAFPHGFFDNVKDQGLVVPWCNQHTVLANLAIGAFLTHCGWNSVLESIWNGVPMICHPMHVDQPTNRKLVVDDWKVGINLCDQGQVNREEFVHKINLIMRGKTCIELREELKKVGSKLRNALEPNGSLLRNLDQFAEDLKRKIYTKKDESNN